MLYGLVCYSQGLVAEGSAVVVAASEITYVITTVCPTSRLFNPACTLIEFVQKTANSPMYSLYIHPRSKISMPICGTSGFGITIVVCPTYAINKGSTAIYGSNNFTLQGTSRTSSTNPNNVMKQMHAKANLYSTSQFEFAVKLKCWNKIVTTKKIIPTTIPNDSGTLIFPWGVPFLLMCGFDSDQCDLV